MKGFLGLKAVGGEPCHGFDTSVAILKRQAAHAELPPDVCGPLEYNQTSPAPGLHSSPAPRLVRSLPPARGKRYS